MLMARRVGFSPRSVEAVSTYGVNIHVIVALCPKIPAMRREFCILLTSFGHVYFIVLAYMYM